MLIRPILEDDKRTRDREYLKIMITTTKTLAAERMLSRSIRVRVIYVKPRRIKTLCKRAGNTRVCATSACASVGCGREREPKLF